MEECGSRAGKHQSVYQSSHLRVTLRGVQKVAEEDAEERQHRCNHGNLTQFRITD